ncbi:DNA alkylation repair protein [Shivajiella indica]|uniref:DNA alkylation repair protein n=1 Tax=Shivajiella indica TaxID=872115 RepID=A0ABW5B962_9BACT
MEVHTPKEIIRCLKELSDLKKAEFFPRFFKTGPGEYGEGDKFLGVTVPYQRSVAKKFEKSINLSQIEELMASEYHEVRLTGLFMLVAKFEKTKDSLERKRIFDFYLNIRHQINNWDMVDGSAPQILGGWLWDKDRDILYKLANSENIWENRMAILATFHFIRKNDFKDIIALAEKLLHHPHDLIHKAVGWMIREVGKRDYQLAYDFLTQHYKNMPRTMLRYAIEKFHHDVRTQFMKGNI